MGPDRLYQLLERLEERLRGYEMGGIEPFGEAPLLTTV